MDWKFELEKLLAHRKTENYSAKYWEKLQNVIIPSLKDIEKELNEYHINSDVSNDGKLSVPGCGFIMEIELDYDKVKITFCYKNPVSPDELPPYKKESIKTFKIDEITEKIIGIEFLEGFIPCIQKFYNK